MSRSFTFSFTFHLWWLWAYLLTGLILAAPLTWALNRHVTPTESVAATWSRHWRRLPVWVAAWPVSVWTLTECERSSRRRRVRRNRRASGGDAL